jgi:hypothetical protein
MYCTYARRWLAMHLTIFQPLFARTWHADFRIQPSGLNEICAMNRILSFGPRGWAILTLAGGAALASPFLRPAQLKKQPSGSELNASETAPTFRTGLATGVTSGIQDTYQVVSQRLPSKASAEQLPSWVSKKSRLDDLLSNSLAPNELPSTLAVEPQRPQELRTWVNDPSQERHSSVPTTAPTIAANRYSPWHSTETQAVTVESNRPDEDSRYADTNWHIESPDVRALLRETAVNSKIVRQKDLQPGALVGASLRSSTHGGKPETPELRKPKFVFQPGLKADDR